MIFSVMQLNTASGADVERPPVQWTDFAVPYDMRHQRKHNFIVRRLFTGFGEKIFQHWNLRQAWNSADRLGVLRLEHSAQQIDFSIFQSNLVLDLPLADLGLADPANTDVGSDRGNVECNLQADISIGIDARGDIDIHANIEILKLCVHKGADGRRRDSGRIGSSRGGHALANLQRSEEHTSELQSLR